MHALAETWATYTNWLCQPLLALKPTQSIPRIWPFSPSLITHVCVPETTFLFDVVFYKKAMQGTIDDPNVNHFNCVVLLRQTDK